MFLLISCLQLGEDIVDVHVEKSLMDFLVLNHPVAGLFLSSTVIASKYLTLLMQSLVVGAGPLFIELQLAEFAFVGGSGVNSVQVTAQVASIREDVIADMASCAHLLLVILLRCQIEIDFHVALIVARILVEENESNFVYIVIGRSKLQQTHVVFHLNSKFKNFNSFDIELYTFQLEMIEKSTKQFVFIGASALSLALLSRSQI